ncbi:hypothetical protein [Deinococcus sonorensis]|uniref:Elongation factor G-binding protein C-terminal treble-clef zinc-finger domain-containing protein n=2 Tax=Deinococcus sonorensis TaxID=309891 RepID=A0AAU7U7U7_9DEIO
MSDHSERDVLRELFPGTARELFGDHEPPRVTLGLYPVADGRMALISGGQLAELEPLEQRGSKAAHCDLCHVTRSRSDVGIFRARSGERLYMYLTLCLNTEHCQRRAGTHGLEALAARVMGGGVGSPE